LISNECQTFMLQTEQLYNHVSLKISKLVTRSYSTSFSIAVSFLDQEIQNGIYSIYGFVRFADEIVDSFDGYDKKVLLEKFENDYYEGIKNGISLNPILHSFQKIVKKYNIPDELVQAFLKSMKYDLSKNNYLDKKEMDDYIYGSAEVVGLMCLRVFTGGDEKLYAELKHPAMKLGAAFQKVNFLRDLKNDMENLDRRYFPEIAKNTFDNSIKFSIIKDIENDFSSSYVGIKKLPNNSKLAVLIAYYYFKRLLKKIKKASAEEIVAKRVRVSDAKKIMLLIKAYVLCKYKFV
jgi:15-cis-phytoene synthase